VGRRGTRPGVRNHPGSNNGLICGAVEKLFFSRCCVTLLYISDQRCAQVSWEICLPKERREGGVDWSKTNQSNNTFDWTERKGWQGEQNGKIWMEMNLGDKKSPKCFRTPRLYTGVGVGEWCVHREPTRQAKRDVMDR
jgi:hypothetical protein